MNKFTTSTLLVCISLILSGCSATGPKFKREEIQNQAKSLLYIYRPATFIASARTATFEVDGKVVAELSNKGYAKIYVDPIKSIVKQSWKNWLFDDKIMQNPLQIEVDFQKGKAHYVRFDIQGMGSWELAEIEEDLALYHIRKTVLQKQIINQ